MLYRIKDKSVSMNFYTFLYVVFVIVELLYGQLEMAYGLSPRLIMLLVMSVICTFRSCFVFDKYWGVYIIFIFSFLVSSFITGYGGNGIKFLIGRYFCAWVLYCSTMTVIKRYKGSRVIVYTLLSICLVDAVVTIAQYFTLPFSYSILDTLHLNITEGFEDSLLYHQSLSGTMEGRSLPGLFGTAVKNGYILAIGAVLALYNKNSKLSLFNFVVWLIIVIALYFCQERSAFGFGLIFSSVYMFFYIRQIKAKWRFPIYLIVAILSLLIVYKLYGVILGGNSKFANKGFDMSDRLYIYDFAIDYFKSNPLGCYFEYREAAQIDPHNIFISAFLYGGIIGGLSIIVILIMQVREGLRFISRYVNYDQSKNTKLIFLLAYGAYIANSLFHNHSIVNGSCTAWILWAAFISFGVKFLPSKSKV